MSEPPEPSRRSSPRALEVWVDGECALCRAGRSWTQRRDRDRLIRFADLHDPLPADIEARRRSRDQLWARDRRGRVVGGFKAWLEVLARVPGWEWLARAAARPPLSWLGPPTYRLVAANRGWLSSLLSSRRPPPARPASRPPATAPRTGPGSAPPV